MSGFVFNRGYEDLGGALDEAVGLGLLRCHVCGRREQMVAGQSTTYLRDGWPKCHDLTMMLFTPRQIAAGEVPA